MTSYTLSPFLLTRVQSGVRLSSDFIFLSSCMLLTFGGFLILFLSFSETNLGSAEKASVKDEGGLLIACAYEASTLWPVSMFLKFHKCKFTCILSGAIGYCFFDHEIISMAIHLSLSSRKVIVRIKCTCPINHIKVKIY